MYGAWAEMFGTTWAIQNCTENAKFMGSGPTSHDMTHWVVT